MGWLKKSWAFITEPKHANALVAIVSFFIFLSTAIYTGFSYLQWKANKNAADAAKRSADVATDTLRDSAITNIQTLRPYVNITEMHLLGEIANDKKFHGEARIMNSGRTPAIDMRVCGDIFIIPTETPITDDYPCPSPENPKREVEKSVFALGPGVFGKIASPGTTAKITPVGLLPLLTAKKIRLYFYGYVTYRDIVDGSSEHHTTFCGVYSAAANDWEVCEKHDKMD